MQPSTTLNVKNSKTREKIFVLFLIVITGALFFLPTGFEHRILGGTVRAKGSILAVDNSEVQQFGIVKAGDQTVTVRVEDGPFRGREVEANNQLVGKMELDTFYQRGDKVLVVLDVDGVEVIDAAVASHYRIDVELILLGVFAVLVLAFARWTGAKAMLSFLFTGLMIWKILLPGYLKGWDPIVLSLGVVAALTGVIIFLVAGVNRKGLVAFLGAAAGIGLTCALSLLFGHLFRVHGAVKPFAETLLYSGFPGIDLGRIFMSGIFVASSGAVMDLAMDVATSMYEITLHKPDITFRAAVRSGFAVGRAVIGTMTTTLLLAYSGGYSAMLMVFMGQGTPMINIFNLNYVAAEILHTLVGSFGLVAVAPLTAVIGGLLLTRRDNEGARVGIPLPNSSQQQTEARALAQSSW